MYSHSRKPPYPLEHHSKGITDNETSADQCDTLSLLIYALMKCVQQLTQVIKVPTGDYVQRKTNDQNEQKWLEEGKDDDIQLGDNSDPTVRPSHLCVPPFLSSNSQEQRGKIPTHTLESVCRKAAWISPSLSPLILSVLSWILQFKTKHSLEWLLKQCQKPGSSFRNHWAQCAPGKNSG